MYEPVDFLGTAPSVTLVAQLSAVGTESVTQVALFRCHRTIWLMIVDCKGVKSGSSARLSFLAGVYYHFVKLFAKIVG